MALCAAAILHWRMELPALPTIALCRRARANSKLLPRPPQRWPRQPKLCPNQSYRIPAMVTAADGSLLVALDGRCAAGKTTIAAQMARQYGWGVVHLDDFFLQPIQRTPQRMAEPGGNLDRERLIAEVLEPLRAGRQGSYRLFDCRTMALAPGTVPLPQTPIILLEGSYSCHPDLWNYCALHAFVDVEPAEQLRRLAARAPEKLEDFKTRWIPKEETYFAHFQIPERCEVKV